MKKSGFIAVLSVLLFTSMLSAAAKVGYYTKKKSIVFTFYPKQMKVKGNISRVNVAGSFNSWKPTLRGWKMWHYKAGKCWILTIPKKWIRRGKKGKSGKYEFKFVVNKVTWVQPPKWSGNLAEDGFGGRNLIVKSSDLK